MFINCINLIVIFGIKYAYILGSYKDTNECHSRLVGALDRGTHW